jgi:hypothetical protein
MPNSITELVQHLVEFRLVCDEAMSLERAENQALSGTDEYKPFEFYQSRKTLLLKLEQSLNLLRIGRRAWHRLEPVERARYRDVKELLEGLQNSLVKILLLDRENQQALLRRGLLPARQVPAFAGSQPHYAAQLYRRHSDYVHREDCSSGR